MQLSNGLLFIAEKNGSVSPPQLPASQRGAALIISLVILLVITMIGLASMKR